MRFLSQVNLAFPLVLSVVALGQTAGKDPAPLSPQELFKRVSPSVFVVEGLDVEGRVNSVGSGVAVKLDQVATNQHVVAGSATVRVRRGQETWLAVVTHSRADRDLCRLKVANLSASTVEIRNSSTLEVGERVYAVGAPEGLELTLSEGLISALRAFPTGRIVQTTAPISRGSSGGGLFDSQGRLVGITTAMLVEGQNLNFAAPAEWVASLEDNPVGTGLATRDAFAELDAFIWVLGGDKSFDKGEYGRAIEAYRKALVVQPESAAAWSGLGASYGALQQDDRAEQAYREAIRHEPNHVRAWRGLGFHYFTKSRWDEAVQALRETTRLQPDDADAW